MPLTHQTMEEEQPMVQCRSDMWLALVWNVLQTKREERRALAKNEMLMCINPESNLQGTVLVVCEPWLMKYVDWRRDTWIFQNMTDMLHAHSLTQAYLYREALLELHEAMTERYHEALKKPCMPSVWPLRRCKSVPEWMQKCFEQLHQPDFPYRSGHLYLDERERLGVLSQLVRLTPHAADVMAQLRGQRDVLFYAYGLYLHSLGQVRAYSFGGMHTNALQRALSACWGFAHTLGLVSGAPQWMCVQLHNSSESVLVLTDRWWNVQQSVQMLLRQHRWAERTHSEVDVVSGVQHAVWWTRSGHLGSWVLVAAFIATSIVQLQPADLAQALAPTTHRLAALYPLLPRLVARFGEPLSIIDEFGACHHEPMRPHTFAHVIVGATLLRLPHYTTGTLLCALFAELRDVCPPSYGPLVQWLRDRVRPQPPPDSVRLDEDTVAFQGADASVLEVLYRLACEPALNDGLAETLLRCIIIQTPLRSTRTRTPPRVMRPSESTNHLPELEPLRQRWGPHAPLAVNSQEACLSFAALLNCLPVLQHSDSRRVDTAQLLASMYDSAEIMFTLGVPRAQSYVLTDRVPQDDERPSLQVLPSYTQRPLDATDYDTLAASTHLVNAVHAEGHRADECYAHTYSASRASSYVV